MAWDVNDISVRERALRAVKAALLADGSPVSTVTRSMVDQIADESLPCYDVSPDSSKQDSTFEDHDYAGVMLPVIVRGVIDATDTDDGALDPLYLFAVRQLCADSTLGGTVDSITWDGLEHVFRPDGRDILGVELRFELKFAVSRRDPAQKG
jgi:hypothetical protein